jgi:DNA-binding NtrC family response regulator
MLDETREERTGWVPGLDGQQRRSWLSRRDQIDLLVTDMRMPWIDGPLLARCLAKDEPDFAVLFISGEHDTSQLGEFKKRWVFGQALQPFCARDRSQPAAEAQHRAFNELMV